MVFFKKVYMYRKFKWSINNVNNQLMLDKLFSFNNKDFLN